MSEANRLIEAEELLAAICERLEQALRYLVEHGRITNREYQALCPDVSAETIRRDLSDLVHKGLLLRIGRKRATYYILKDADLLK